MTISFKHRLAVLALGMGCCLAAQADVVFANFSSVSDLNLQGSAAQAGNVLRLTPSAPGLTGSAWYDTKVKVGNGFITTFDFRISNLVNTGSDGFSFTLQSSSPTALGVGGGGLGFAGIGSSFSIKFDAHTNAFEPLAPFVGFQPNGLDAQSASLGSTNVVPNFKDGNVHTARIAYTPGDLSLYIDNMNIAVLSRAVDLSTIFSLDQGTAYMGFTGSTGGGYENHDILAWTEHSVPEPAGWALWMLALVAASAAKAKRRRDDELA